MPLILPSRLLGQAASAGFREATEQYTSVETGYDDPGTQVTNPSRLVAPVPTVPMPETPRAAEPAASFEMPSLDDLIPDSWRDAAGTATTAVQSAGQQAAQQARSFGESVLGSVDDWIPDTWKPPAPAQPDPSMQSGFTSMPTGAPTPTGDLRAYTRAKAQSLGIDPDIAERVAMSEGGFDNPVRQSDVVNNGRRETSYGPFQLFIGGGLGDTALARGIDPRNPQDVYRGIDFALETARSTGWGPWHGAARVGIGNWQGIGAVTPGPAPATPRPGAVQAEQTPAAQAQAGGLDVQGITQAYRGVPYVFGGAGGRGQGVGTATDCSGFVSAVWKEKYGVSLPAHTDAAYNALRGQGAPEVGVKDARPGDVVFYMGAGTGGAITHHMGIYAGGGKVLDMSTSGGGGVRERDVGHAGQFVILRDPRINTEPARTASVPPPIVPTGIAEQTGGEKLTRTEMARLSLNADGGPAALSAPGPEGGIPAPSGPTARIGMPMPENPADAPQEGYSNPSLTPMPAPPTTVGPLPDDALYRQPLSSAPVRDNWAAEQPYDPDQGPREATPGSVGASPPVYDPRIADEAAGARELPSQLVAVPQAPVGGYDDSGTQPVNPVAGPPVPPRGAPNFYQDIVQPVIRAVTPQTGLVEGVQRAWERGGQPATPTSAVDRGAIDAARTIIDPVQGAAQGAASAYERATGGPPGSVLQASQDVSNFFAPVAPLMGAVQRGGGMADDAARAARRGVNEWLSGEPGIYTAHRGSLPGEAVDTVYGGTFLASQRGHADSFNTRPGMQTVEHQVRVERPYVMTGDRVEAYARAEAGPSVSEENIQRFIEQIHRDGLSMVGRRGGQWLRDQGYDAVMLPHDFAEPTSGPVMVALRDLGGMADDSARVQGTAALSTPGISPGPGAVNAVGNAVGGGITGTFAGAMVPAETDEERRRNMLTGAALGAVGAPIVGRVAGRHMNGGALATPGISPGQPHRLRTPGQQPITLTPAEEVSRLRLDKFPAELQPHIQQAAESVDFAHAARRGVIPDAAAEQMADTITRSVDDWVSKSRIGKALNTEETRALRNLVTGQARVVDDLAKEIAEAESSGVVTDLLITRAHTEGEKLASLVSVMEGARAEAGRTLRAWTADTRVTDPTEAAQRIFRKFGGGPEGRQRALDALKEFNQIPPDDAIGQAKFWNLIERGGRITSADVLTAIRYNSMLSSPRTWEIGWIGSVLQAPPKMLSDIMAAVSRPGSGELTQAARGAAAGAQAGLRPLWETLRHGITSEAALAGQLPRGLAARASSTPGRVAGTVIDLPGRMVAAPDAFFSSLFRGMESGRQAAIAAHRAGLTGEARAEFVQDFLTRMPKDAETEVTRVVDDLMLRGDMGRFGRWAVNGISRDPLIASFVAPFMRISYHIWTQGLDLTPVGALGTAVDVARGAYRGGAVPQGVRPLAERARYNAIGLGITGGAVWHALNGNVSGIGPDDTEKRDQLRATGWQPYSVKIGDQWVSYANWGPVAVPLSMAAAYAENQQYKKADAKPEDQLFDMTKRVAQLVTEQTFLQGIGNVMNAFEDPQRYLPQLLAGHLTSLVPYGSALNTVGQSQDDAQRRPDRASRVGIAENLAQTAEGRIPINPLTPDRGDVPPAQDPLGRTVPNQMSGGMAFQPFRVSQQRPDPIISAFQAAGVDIGAPRDEITDLGIKVELSPDETRRWNTLRGEVISTTTQRLIDNGALGRMPKEWQVKQLEQIKQQAADVATAKLKAEIGSAAWAQRMRARLQVPR